MTKTKLWTKDFIIMAAATFFIALIFILLMTTMAMYAIQQFNASPSQAGLAAGIFVIGALIGRLLAGKYMEVIGRKKLLYSSLVLFLLATLLYFAVDTIGLLLIVRFIHGSAFGFSATTLATAAMSLIPEERRGEGTGYFSLSPALATAVGPFLGVIISQQGDYSRIFSACTVFTVISMILLLFSHIPEAKLTSEQRQSMKGFRFQDYFEQSALPISGVMLLMGIAFSGIMAFINSYAAEINLVTTAGFFFLVYAAAVIISRLFTGRLMDRKGDNFVMYPALLVFSASLLVLSQVEQGAMLLFAGVLGGLGFGTLMSCSQAIAVKQSPEHKVGLAISTYFFFLDAGTGVGPFLLGMLIPVIEFRGMYMTLAVGVLLSVFIYYYLHGKKVASRSQQAEEPC